MSRISSRTAAVLAISLVTIVSSVARSSAPVRLTVVSTADFHGALEPRREKALEKRTVGGIDIISAYINAIREQDPEGLILLDGGDLYQGTLLSAASEGRAVIDFYNELRYDAAVVGNHDFDFGPIGFHSVASSAGEDPLGTIKARVAQARFPFLAANMVDTDTGRIPPWKNLAPYVVIERKGVKVGIVGLTSPDTPLITNPVNIKKLRFEPLVETARRYVREVRKKGAATVIILVHAGIKRDPETGRPTGPVADLAREMNPGDVDLIVSGHSHVPFSDFVDGIGVVQAGAKGSSFARAELVVDPASGRVLPGGVRLYPVTFFFRTNARGGAPRFAGRLIRPLPHFARKLAQYKKTIKHLESVKLGIALATMPNRQRYDSAVGNVVTDAMLAAAPEADVAMYNSGGLRAPLRKGTITYADVYEVVPFDNYMVVVTLTGEQLRSIIEYGLGSEYGVMEVAGLTVGVNPAGPAGGKCMWIKFSNGTMLEPLREYRVVTNDFVYRGGDGYVQFAAGKDFKDTHRLVRDAFAEYVKKRKKLIARGGRRYIVDAVANGGDAEK